MLILGIESSCDETAASVASIGERGIEIKSNIVASQISTHALYGGVVPEIASRAHAEALTGITEEALNVAGIKLSDVDAFAVTCAPGLIGALLTGVNFAKGLAYSTGKPLVAVDHIKGHVSAAFIEHPELKPPFLALAVSGGHTSIMDVRSYTDFVTVGHSRDDALGECFDKTARVLGIPYPGGKEMDRLASLGDKTAYKFPSAALAGDNLDFSFSGVKTAVINTIHNAEQKGEKPAREDIAASLTDRVVRDVVAKTAKALELTGRKALVVAGGVAANSHLRRAFAEYCEKNGIALCIPSLQYCGDNGAMIAVAGYYEYLAGRVADLRLNAEARSGKSRVGAENASLFPKTAE